MKLNLKALEKQWYTLKGEDGTEVSFCIRPFPLSKIKTIKQADIKGLWMEFDYCLTDWKGIEVVDEEFKVNKKNKQIMFDFKVDVREFVFKKAQTALDSTSEQLKN